jgi:CelD/BcsL family acetyltransferase involved in cellulose biosynthesis
MGDAVQIVTPPAKLSVSVAASETEFTRLESVWNRLALSSSRPVPFLTWEWISTWWKHFHGDSRLFVLVARDESDQVVGLAPLKITMRKGLGVVPARTVEFLGYRGSAVCADHLDFLASPQDRHSVVDRLAEAILARQEEWDAVILADLAEDSPVPEALARRNGDQGLPFARATGNTCPYVSLGRDWAGFLKAMKKKRRSFVKCRRERLASSHTVRFACDGSVDHVHQHIETLARLHGDSRGRKGERGNFHLPSYLSFHHELAERMAAAGRLYLARLDCDNRTVAMVYGFHVGETLFDYQKGYDTAFSHFGVGSVLQGMIIQDAIERLHATEMDFLRGPEDYKYFWTQRDRHTGMAVVWGQKLAGRSSEAEFLLRRRLSPWKHRVQVFWESESAA